LTFLGAFGPPDPSERVSLAFADLDEDGHPEALAYFVSPTVCGTGGCQLAIFQQHGQSFRPIGGTTVSGLPLRLLLKKTHGFHDLGIWSPSSGNFVGFEARLRFDGKSYRPSNPSRAPHVGSECGIELIGRNAVLRPTH
jgi:hypothetical protein